MKKWILFFALIVLIIFTLFSQHKLILSEYAKFFTIDNAMLGADAIVVLSGGKTTRINHALKLFSEGYAPRLIFTEEKRPSSFLSNLFPTNEQIVDALVEKNNMNVPIINVPSIKGGATSTFDEAYDLRKFIDEKKYLHMILVTDAFHTKRALLAFNKVFDNSKVHFEMSAAQNEIFNEENWWTSDQGISAYVLESIKYPIYLISSKNFDFIRND